MCELGRNQINLIPNGFSKPLALVFVDNSSKSSVSRCDSLILSEDLYHPALEVTIEITGNLLHNSHPNSCIVVM